MAAVELADLGRGVGHEGGLRRHPLAVVAPHVAGVDVQPAVVVVVEEGRAHPGPVILYARRRGHVLEAHPAASEPEVPVQVLASEVVGHQQVGPPVAVVVAPCGGEVIAVVPLVETRFAGGFDETPVAVVPEEHAGGAVAGVVVRHRRARLVLARAVVEGIDTEVEVEKPVAVVIGHGDGHGGALEPPLEAEGVLYPGEAPTSVVREEDRSRAHGEHQVLVAVVVHVGEERLRRVVEYREPSPLRHVLERPITPSPVESVRQARRLGHVDILAAVPVGVPDRDAVVAVGIAGEPGVDRGHPRIEARRS